MKFIKALAATALMLVGQPALASSADVGAISSPFGTTTGVILFFHSGTRSSPKPACQHPDLPTRWAIDGRTTEGQAMLSIFLLAYSSNKRVAIAGTGNCSAWGDTETVLYLAIID
jgi:hypothetical protein